MKITNHIEIDMAQRLPIPPVSAVQNDANTRVIEVTAVENGQKWEVPDGVTPAVAFRKPDGRKGLYDELPDGTKAVTFSENMITAVLAPQVLTCSGQVHVAIVFMDAELNRLATFPFIVEAAHDPSGGSGVSSDYYKYSTMEAVSEAVDAALSELETSKQDFLDKAVEALEVVKGAATEDAPAIICEAKGEIVTASDASNRTLAGLTVYGKTTQNGTPAPDSPVELQNAGASGTIKTTVAGENLLPFPYALGNSYTENGVTSTVSNDGRITLNGTATADAWFYLTAWSDSHTTGLQLPVGRYWLSGSINEPDKFNLALSIYKNGVFQRSSSINAWFEVFDMAERIDVRIQVYSGTTMNNVEFSPMIAVTNDGIYKPYKGQTLTVQTPNGLPGIPFDYDGNYTDANGQQYRTDVKDYGAGVRHNFINRVIIDGSTYISSVLVRANSVRVACWDLPNGYPNAGPYGWQLCNRLVIKPVWSNDDIGFIATSDNSGGIILGLPLEAGSTKESVSAYLARNPLEILYPLAEPTETPIPAEEMAAYAALHTNKPNTTVYNDAGAGMVIEYVADTKLYIDQKIAAISAAMINA